MQHPSESQQFRRAITILITLAFSGGLLFFTAQANLNLLQALYPDPQFVIFGLLALEGGVIYWTGYYLLVQSGNHRAIAIAALVIDAGISGVGFFMEMLRITHAQDTANLPSVPFVVAVAVSINVAFSLIAHLLPEPRRQQQQYITYTPAPAPKEPERYYPASFDQTGEVATAAAPRRPGRLQNVVANMIAGGQDTLELAQQIRDSRRAPAPAPAQAPAQIPAGGQATTVTEETPQLEPELKK